MQITHELEVADDCEVQSLAGEPVLRMGDVLIHATIDYLGATSVTSGTGSFKELTETQRDTLYAALKHERMTITEIRQ